MKGTSISDLYSIQNKIGEGIFALFISIGSCG